MIGHDFQCLNPCTQVFGFLKEQPLQIVGNRTHQHLAAVLRRPDTMIFQREKRTCVPAIACVTHRTSGSQYSLSDKHRMNESRIPASAAAFWRQSPPDISMGEVDFEEVSHALWMKL